MYVEENKTQLTLSCIYNMLEYGHLDIAIQFIKEGNEKMLIHGKNAFYYFGYEKTWGLFAEEGWCSK